MKRNNSSPAKFAVPFFCLFVVLLSCQPEHHDNNCTPNMNTISGTYKLLAVKYKASATAQEQDLMAFMDNCEKDDLITLNSNGTYTYRDAGAACSPKGDDAGSWSVTGNTIISDGLVAGTIQSFDCSTLAVYTSDLNIPGDKTTITIKKQ